MKVLYLHQYFRTPSQVGSAGMRSYEFSKRLVANGHEVNIVASSMDLEAFNGWKMTNENGANVHWVSVPYDNKMSTARRIMAFLQFAVKATIHSCKLAKDADVIIATSTPLTIAIPAIAASKFSGKPMVFEVRDLWPEAAIQTGFLKGRLFIFLAKLLEKVAYNNATKIIALSPGMRDGIEAVSPKHKGKIEIIPNCSDLDKFGSHHGEHKIEAMNAFEGKFVCSYLGTLGYANELEYIVEVAKCADAMGYKDLLFYLVGQGRERDALNALIDEYGLSNVVVDGPYPPAVATEIADRSDACLTLFRDLPVLHTCSPNKFFDSLAAGKPVISNMRGWIADLIKTNNCGINIDSADPAAAARAIVELRKAPHLLKEMGKNSRILAEREFSRDILAKKFDETLASLSK